ncbi:hypothetical protein Dda_3619 [Drechslerella dactyloides]|uniref:Deacetylase sirtuin-type domain-containing protein n=1 Tax=Drechslerella dactyloides TaxID=74499 RepID=A0AAD6IY97_DREDA|nr:hypothetical protein Dda_3619 [Drechslerella dactyloides]
MRRGYLPTYLPTYTHTHAMLLRIPYTAPFTALPPLPSSATTLPAAVTAVANFLAHARSTVVLSGAGISVASGLPDYRGAKGTYTLNKEYRPTFFSEFVHGDRARRRYWARSFLGWRGVEGVRPNRGHDAVARLWRGGWVGGVVTQNVDSLHTAADADLPVTNLHGLLATIVCLTCRTTYPRAAFQLALRTLNPSWAAFLDQLREDPSTPVRRNPDGDIDVPGVEYESFRYPPCKTCLENPAYRGRIPVDNDGAALPSTVRFHSEADTQGHAHVPGVLKPTLVFFGESVLQAVKDEAEARVDAADAILVLGSSLATYSAWRLVRRAREQGKKIGVVNLGGVRGEAEFWSDGGGRVGARYRLGDGRDGVRVEFDVGEVLDGAVEVLLRTDQREKNILAAHA